MGIVKSQVSVSLDGFMAGPDQSPEDPLGKGGEALHEWLFKASSWQAAHGREEGEGAENPSDAVLAAATANVGAVVMGRNMFGPIRGPWPDEEWRGWWGEDPPFHAPVFVLTHFARDPVEMEGGTSFHFVTDGVRSAVARAREAAGEQDVSIAGGAATLQGVIAAGLLDEILVSQVPILLGSGERLFDGLAADAATVELAELVKGPEAAHFRYRLSR